VALGAAVQIHHATYCRRAEFALERLRITEVVLNLMKTRRLTLAALLLSVLLVGCRPERMQPSTANTRKVTFTQAGVSLAVGEEWECKNPHPDSALYPPTLVSPAGAIRVVLLPPDRSDPATVADGLRAAFDRNPRAAKHSFHRQQFANDHGVRGLCVSYLQQIGKNGSASVVENSHYLVKSRAGRCVVVNYLASADTADTAAIHRMLRTGLSLQ
jgi:hypothetical protein